MSPRTHLRASSSSLDAAASIAHSDVRRLDHHFGLVKRVTVPQAELVRGGQVPVHRLRALPVADRIRLTGRYYALLMADLRDELVERFSAHTQR